MCTVDYDPIAAKFDRRYRRNDWQPLEEWVRAFVAGGRRVLDVGCGTGHWVELVARAGAEITGIDRSREMLARARDRHAGSTVLRATAEALPCATAAFDRVICINAIHHFPDPVGFIREARRVLAPRGALAIIALDPSHADEPWYIYDWFPGTREADRARYPATARIRDWMTTAGLIDCRTEVAMHFPGVMPARAAIARGFLDHGATSQLTLLSAEAYAAGMANLTAAIAERESKGETLELAADLRLFATTGRVP